MLIDVGYALACVCCVCSWGALCTDLPGSLALAFGHVHTLDVVYVRGGHCALTLSLALAFGHVHTSYGVYVMGVECTDLVGWPRRG